MLTPNPTKLWLMGPCDRKRRVNRLKTELTAIILWDILYLESLEHDEIDQLAYHARTERRKEILTDLATLCQLN